ncbi:hypothetical protein [Brevibacterium album]|uniref:hypothetical protein n=1 Tax=Brevibacterium album TaxID=417948 RepID=UPI000A063C65|nr:hypothetical protein [Brevibacterium album]
MRRPRRRSPWARGTSERGASDHRDRRHSAPHHSASFLSRDSLERHQVWWYLIAVPTGAALGLMLPGPASRLGDAVWPVLAVLLFATFAQVSVRDIPRALRDRRFLTAALLANFALVPLLVAGLVRVVPQDEPLVLGLLLVLLVPCTDWFLTFTHLGGGDAARASALTPLTLGLQLLLLPVYLSLFTGFDMSGVFGPAALAPALWVLGLPLAAALAAEAASPRLPSLGRLREGSGVLPVPLLALVLLIVAASHITQVSRSLAVLPWVLLVSLLYLAGALAIAVLVARAMRLPTAQGRTLAFSLSTRNSFIVLPFALSLPAGWEVTAAVIVTQSLLELCAMIACVRIVPRTLFRELSV